MCGYRSDIASLVELKTQLTCLNYKYWYVNHETWLVLYLRIYRTSAYSRNASVVKH